MECYREVKERLVTPGGDPVYECPICGYRHIYGVEHTTMLEECPQCKTKLKYPWQKEK